MKKFFILIFILFSANAYAFLGGSYIPPYPCALGYTREGNNFCAWNNNFSPIYLTVNSSSPLTCQESPNWRGTGAGRIIGATHAVFLSQVSFISTATIGTESLHGNFFGANSSCSLSTAFPYEFDFYNPLSTSGTTLLATSTTVDLFTTGSGQFYYEPAVTNNGATLQLTIVGYYQ